MANPDEQKQKAPQGLSWGSGDTTNRRPAEQGNEVVGVFGSNARTHTQPSAHPKANDELFVPPVKHTPGHAGAFGAPPRGSFVPKQMPATPIDFDQSFDEHTEPTRVVSLDELNAQAGQSISAPSTGAQPPSEPSVAAKVAPTGLFGGAPKTGGPITQIIEPKESDEDRAERDTSPPSAHLASSHLTPAQGTPVQAESAVSASTDAADAAELKLPESHSTMKAVEPVAKEPEASGARFPAIASPEQADAKTTAPDPRLFADGALGASPIADRKRSVVGAVPQPAKVTRPESRSLMEAVVPPTSSVFTPVARKESISDLKAQFGATMLGVSPPPMMSKPPAAQSSGQSRAVPTPSGAASGDSTQRQKQVTTNDEEVRREPVSLPPEDVEFLLEDEASDPSAFVELDAPPTAHKPPAPPARAPAAAVAPAAPSKAAAESSNADEVVSAAEDAVTVDVESVPPAAGASAGEEFSLGLEGSNSASFAGQHERTPSKVNATLVGTGPDPVAVQRLVQEAEAEKQRQTASAATMIGVPPLSEPADVPTADVFAKVAEQLVEATSPAAAVIESEAPAVRPGFPRRAILTGALVGLLGGAAFALINGDGSLAPIMGTRPQQSEPATTGPVPSPSPSPAAAENAPSAVEPALPAEPPSPAPAEPPVEANAAEPEAEAVAEAESEAKVAEPAAAAGAAQPVAAIDEPAAKPAEPEPAAVKEPEPAKTAAIDVPVGANKAQVLALARERLAAGDAAGAEQLLRPLIEKSPEDHHVMEPLAQALLALGRNEEALKYAQFMVKRRRNRSPYFVILGDALKATGKVQEAQDAYIQALDLDPDNGLAKRRLE